MLNFIEGAPLSLPNKVEHQSHMPSRKNSIYEAAIKNAKRSSSNSSKTKICKKNKEAETAHKNIPNVVQRDKEKSQKEQFTITVEDEFELQEEVSQYVNVPDFSRTQHLAHSKTMKVNLFSFIYLEL